VGVCDLEIQVTVSQKGQIMSSFLRLPRPPAVLAAGIAEHRYVRPVVRPAQRPEMLMSVARPVARGPLAVAW
jgi:hypothetical protein